MPASPITSTSPFKRRWSKPGICSASLSALSIKARRRFNRYIFHLFPEGKTLYADYEEYLRGDLRLWAEGILLDPRTLERGIFNPAALRSLMDRHLAGKEEWTIGKIAPLISFEMSLRRLLDGDMPGSSMENAFPVLALNEKGGNGLTHS